MPSLHTLCASGGSRFELLDMCEADLSGRERLHRWRPLKLAGRSFAFHETGVVSSMFAPHEDGVPLLNISTFSVWRRLIIASSHHHVITSTHPHIHINTSHPSHPPHLRDTLTCVHARLRPTQTNVTLVEESDLERALAAFELPHKARTTAALYGVLLPFDD